LLLHADALIFTVHVLTETLILSLVLNNFLYDTIIPVTQVLRYQGVSKANDLSTNQTVASTTSDYLACLKRSVDGALSTV
jgi:hypothetical protein